MSSTRRKYFSMQKLEGDNALLPFLSHLDSNQNKDKLFLHLRASEREREREREREGERERERERERESEIYNQLFSFLTSAIDPCQSFYLRHD